MPPALKCRVFNQWTAREILKCLVIHSLQASAELELCEMLSKKLELQRWSKIRDLPEGICGLVRNGCIVSGETQFHTQHPEGDLTWCPWEAEEHSLSHPSWEGGQASYDVTQRERVTQVMMQAESGGSVMGIG